MKVEVYYIFNSYFNNTTVLVLNLTHFRHQVSPDFRVKWALNSARENGIHQAPLTDYFYFNEKMKR